MIHINKFIENAEFEINVLKGVLNAPIELVDWRYFARTIEVAISALEAAQRRSESLATWKEEQISKLEAKRKEEQKAKE